MLEIIAQVGNPMMIRAYRDFVPGQIVKLVRTNHEAYCSLSNSVQPFGVVIGLQDQFGQIPVLYNSASLLRTDNFEEGLEYAMGSLVYSSEMGVFTSVKCRANSIPIAYVENELVEGDKALEIRWI
jgi:hypothetical protein